MNTRATNRASLTVDADPSRPGSGVGIYGLDPSLMAALGGYIEAGGLLQSILRVTVVRAGATIGDDLPDVFGCCRLLEDGVRFNPHFPFERGLSYRASFDPRPLGPPELSDALTLEFSFPREQIALPTEVTHIYPSSDRLPENLLRFYVCFSNPMQRGCAEAEIELLDSDGEPTLDALYRAPVELWDRSMQRLTILLDPGRLKREVGPNRALGPPLKADQTYALAVGARMTDFSGERLSATVSKRFRVADAVREPIAVEQWKIAAPMTNSCEPLALMFPRPLDWALLSDTISVASTSGRWIEGRVAIDQRERRWSFTPTAPWAAGSYRVRIASTLEDVCGNSVVAAFDRPLRPGSDSAYEAASRSIPFDLT